MARTGTGHGPGRGPGRGPGLKTVVTGGLGMIGAAVVRELLRLSRRVLVLDLAHDPDLKTRFPGPWRAGEPRYDRVDVGDPLALCAAFRGAAQVYHMAGELGTTELDHNPHAAVRANIVGTLNVLEAARTMGVGVVFYPSKPRVWLNTYTVTKGCADDFVRLYNRLHGPALAVVSLRYFNAVGPEQHLYPVRKMLPCFCLQAMHGLPVEVFGDGSQTVDLVHVDDLATVSVEAADRRWTEDVPDCGSGTALSVNQVAALVNDHYGNKAGVKHLPMRPGEEPGTRLVADTAALGRALGRNAVAHFKSAAAAVAATAHRLRQLPAATVSAAMEFYGWTAGAASARASG